MLKDLTLAQLAKLHNTLVRNHELDEKQVKRFSDKSKAMKKIRAMLRDTGDAVIKVLEPEYEKRGRASDRWGILESGMTRSEYILACVKIGHDRGEATRDLRYNVENGLIALYDG